MQWSLGFSQTAAVILAELILVCASIIGAKTLHDKMLTNIVRSPMSFFDTTPIGRILNRFSRDICTIDETIPSSVFMFFDSVVVVIAMAMPVFTFMILPLGVLYLAVQVSTTSHTDRDCTPFHSSYRISSVAKQ